MSFSSSYLKLRKERAGTSSGGTKQNAVPPEEQNTAASESSFNQNYMALRNKRSSMTISEKVEKRVRALKKKQGATSPADVLEGRKTGSKSYYTRPEFGTQNERLYGSVTALDAALAEKRTPLETAVTALRKAESDLKTTQGYVTQARAAYEQDPSEENAAYYNQVAGAYEQARQSYNGAFDAYSAAFSEYEPYEAQLIDALTAYQLYNEQQNAAFDDWRGTIRDAATIRQEIEAADAGIAELEKKIGTLEALTRGPKDALGAVHQESLRKATEELQAMQQSQALLQEELDWSQHYRYTDLMDAADFGAMSAYASTANGKEAKRHPLSGLYTETGFDDLTYDYINRNEAARGKALVSSIADNTALLGLDTSYLEQMTDDEIAIFNYLYATQGPDAAYEYTAYLTTTLTQRQRMAQEAQWAQYAAANPVAASAFSVAMSPLKGVSFLGQATDKAADGTIDQNAAYNKFSYAGSAIRNQVADQIEKSGKWGPIGSFAYQTGMSMGDFLLNTAITGGNQTLSLAIMGSGAAADTVIAGKDRGLSDDQAFTLGAVAGLAEIAMEKISLDTLLNPSLLRNGSVKYVLKNMVAEGSEEVGTDLINLFADILIAKDQSEWQQSIDGYAAQGMSEKEAFGAALKDQLLTMGADFLGGALSGGIMSGAGAIAGNRFTNKQAQELEELELSDEDIQLFIETGLESAPDTDAYHIAQEMQQKLEAGQELSSSDLSRLYQANIQAVYEEQQAEEQPKGLTLRAVDAEETTPAPLAQSQGAEAENNAAPRQREPEWNGGTVHGEYEQNGRPAAAQPEIRRAAGEYVSDGSGERPDGAGAGEQTGILAGGPVGAARRRGANISDAARAAAARQNLARNLRLEKVSSLDLGLSNGTEVKNVQVMPMEHWDEEMGLLAYRVYQETGRNVTFVMGRIQIRTSGGIGYARGVITPDRLIVQADNLNVAMEKITDHELYHAKTDFAAEMGGDLTAEIRDRVLERFTEDEFSEVLDRYIEALRGVIDVAGAQSIEEYTRAVRQVEEELLADAYAGINAFGAGADKFTEVVNESMDRIGMGKRREQDNDAVQPTGPPSDRYSYAGENANNADLDALARAKEMQAAGVAEETIRQQTGWHVGMDGKWRWEIDDSKMQYSSRGDIGFRERNPGYVRYRELLDKANRHAMELSDEALTESERTELNQLSNIWKGTFQKPGRITEDALPMDRLADYIKHDELFEAYPQLRKATLRFAKLEDGVRGQYNPSSGEITLSESLRRAPEETLIHEIQHAIQKAEGFAGGSSTEFWAGQQVAKPEYQEEIRKAEAAVKDVEAKFRKEWTGDTNLNLVKRYINLDNQLWADETDPIMLQDLTGQMEQIEELVAESGWEDLFHEYYYAVGELQLAKERAKLNRRTPYDLYRNTAGEIEARDAAARRKLTAEQRRGAAPDLGDDMTVFAEEADDLSLQLGERFSVDEGANTFGEDLTVYDSTANLKEQTVAKYLEEYASKSSPNYAQAYIARMTPDQFLRLTTSDVVSRWNIEEQSTELDEERMQEANAEQPISLWIDTETGEITGHEGRHRMVALNNAGIRKVPVLLFDSGNKYTKTDLDKLELHGQFNMYSSATIGGAIPLSYANQERIIKKYATQSSVQRMRERYEGVRTMRFSVEDDAYLEAVESEDMRTAQKMVDEAAERWGAYRNNEEANEIFPQDGRIRTFYHGTNTGDFNTFDAGLLGSSSGDLGWFGKGFYFAFSHDEAATYGRRVIPAYLKMRKPFDYSQLYKFNGSDKGASEYARFAWVYNITKQFPELAKGQKVWAYPNDAEAGSAVSWKQLVGWMDRIQEEKQFTVEKVEQGDGTMAFELRADPEKNSWTNPDGETFEWTEYGMRRLFATERDAKEPINQIGAYLEERLGIEPIPRRTIEEIDFSGAVQRAGYDGIIQSMSGDEAVVFTPEQIKSAEPVTYDDDGNVIPLSKRFDSGNADIRYSVDDANTVERYMDEGEGSSVFRSGWLSRNQSVAEGIAKHRPQTETAAFRRWFGDSAAVNVAGEPLVVFHGTKSRFTSFRSDGRPIWFSSNPVYSGAYAGDRRKIENVLPGSAIYAGAEQRTIPAYIRAEHPADFGDTDRTFTESAAQLAADLRINEAQLRDVWEQTGRKERLWETVNTPEMTELLRSHGYDSVRARESGTPTWGIFDGTQAKSAVANTGSFDGNRADIRYSAEEEGGAKKQPARKKVGPIAESRPIIAKRNLKNAVLNTFSIPSGMRAAMGDMIDLYADRLLKNGSLSEEDRQFFFDRLYESGVMTMPADEYYAEARNYMKGGRIYVSDDVVADLGDDWNDIRKRAFAAGLYLTRSQVTDGHQNTGIDVWNGELATDLPGLFDSEETDQRTILERIIWVAEAGKEEQLSLQEYTARLAQEEYVSEDEILDNMERQMDWALRTFAESARLEIKLRDRTGVKIAEERGKATWRAEQQRAKEAKRRADERQARKESAQRQKERRELRELQQKTLKQLQWLSKNRNRAPEELKETWNEVLGDIDLYAVGAANEMRWSDKHGATWKDLAQMYKDAQKNDPNFLPSKELERIVARLDGTKIAEMDVGALQDLYKAAIGLRTEFYNRNNVINDEMQRLFAEVYSDVKREMEEAPGGFTGGVMDKLMNLDQLTPMNVMQRMAGWDPDSAFYSMAKQLERGERDMRAYSVKAQKMLQDFLTEHEEWVKKADGQGEDAIWYEVEVPQLLELGMGDKPIFGETVKVYMTPAQKVHMYLESKNLDNLRHMTGGRTFANRKLYSEGKRQEALSQGRTIRLAPETVRKLVSDLTPEEMELARILDRYYNTFATQEINKVSNILYGYDKAMGKNYAPIYTNRNYTKTEFGVFDTTAEGVGNLKGRQYAVNPSYNISAFDAFERHVDQTARFCGMAIPARNWTTLMNWREQNNSTGDVITHKWGEESKRYITDLITTLQGGDSAKTDTLSAGVSKLQSNYITAIFGANPSIVLKQLGSIPLAGAYLDARNVPTLAQIQGIDRDLIGKYTQELEWRTMGYTTPETKQLKDNPNWTQTNKTFKFIFGGGAITAMDGWAASTLWPWAENKVRREHPELEMGTKKQVAAGESPFYKKVAEEFENALTRSQSVSDEIHQGSLRKSKNPITKAFTMFRSDSAQTYNALRQKIGEAQYYARTGAKDEVIDTAKKAVGAAFTAMMVNAAWAEAINFLMALWKNKGKYYRDDDDELTILSAGGEMISGMLGSFAGVVTGGEELFDIVGNLLTGETWYGIDTPGMEQLNDLIDTVTKAGGDLREVVAGGWDILKNGGNLGNYFGKHSGEILGGIKDLAEAAAMYLPGLPVSNMEAYLLGAVKWISPELGAAYDDLFSDVGKSDLAGAEGRTLQSRIGGILSGRNISESHDTAEALAALYEAGHKTAVPGDTPTSISVDGEKRALGAHQQQAYDTIWGGVVADALDDIVASEVFAEADAETKAKMLSNLYSYAAERAKMELFDDYEPDSGAVKNAAIVAAGASVAECITWNTITSGMKSAEKSAELAAWDLPDPAKRAIFLNKISDSREDTITAFSEAGLTFDQFLQAYSKYGEINAMDLKASGKALEFAHWTNGQGYSEEQAAVVKDELTYFNMTPASSTRYEKLVDAGMDPEDAYDLAGELNGLQAEDGANSVSDLQKWRASVDFSGDVEDQLTALYAVMSEAQYQKVEIAHSFGVSPDAYVTLQEVKPRFDANGNGSYTNAEIKAAVDSMGSRCTKEQKAVLWQLATGSKSAKNNPYSPQIGQKVLDAKAAAKEAAAQEEELEGLTLGNW